jgi:hypothetical protein
MLDLTPFEVDGLHRHRNDEVVQWLAAEQPERR